MGVSKNRGIPKWMVKIMETPIKRERATMGGWFLKENKHKTLRFKVFYAPEGSEMLVKR